MSTTTPRNQNPSGGIAPGDRVQDREQIENPNSWQHIGGTPSTGVVIDVLDVPAERVEVERIGRTVAEDNPEYPEDDKVAQVVWAAALNEVATLWAGFELDTLRELARTRDEVRIYHFPVSRLVPADEEAAA